MKIDFYELFSQYIPDDLSEEDSENYFAAKIKSRVMDNASTGNISIKSRRMRKPFRIVFAAAAAIAVLITCTLAASAMGIIDLEKVFGFMFSSGFNNLDNITAVPQNVVTTGDDRLSMKVLGIGGTENEAFGVIEIKRNDGGSFPENIRAVVQRDSMTYSESGSRYTYRGGASLEVIGDTTAICKFRVFDNSDEIIIGSIYKITFTDITDVDVFNEMYDAETDEKGYLESVDALALLDKSVILRGEWSISFPLEYTADYRVLNVEEEFENETVCGTLTEVGYSAISADIIVKNIGGELRKSIDNSLYEHFIIEPNVPLEIKLSNGTAIYVQESSVRISYNDGQYDMRIHYRFDDIIDIDSIKKIIVGDTVIRVK